jgi:hypothetical protein
LFCYFVSDEGNWESENYVKASTTQQGRNECEDGWGKLDDLPKVLSEFVKILEREKSIWWRVE